MSTQNEMINTIIIGGGQAGLAMSYLLTQQDRDHLVLEKQEQIGDSWRGLWDSFTLVTPNWQLKLPGYPYQGDEKDGFLTRDEVIDYLEDYTAHFEPPLRFGVEVTAVLPRNEGNGYLVQTTEGDYQAQNVVIAVGAFQSPAVPEFSRKAPEAVVQLHSSEYRNPAALPQGNVLVVGSGQSGCQIAQELQESGRQVYLCTGKAGRLPRRYRGKDSFWWVNRLGLFDQTVADLESPAERFAPNPQASGRDGGQDLNLHQFAREGIRLLGHLDDFQGQKAILADDLHKNLAVADRQAAQFIQGVDRYVQMAGLDAPVESVVELQDGYEQEVITELDLARAEISTIIWATGFAWDFSWIRLPIFDEWGYPVQDRGVTQYPGLYFLGLPWLHKRKSGLFLGVGEDAEHLAEHMALYSPEPVAQ